MACRAPLLLLLSLALLSPLALADSFEVGGNDHWVLKPVEEYQKWSADHKFYVHDWLVFHYKRGEDRVLHVTKEHFDTCNRTAPLTDMGSGESVYKLDWAGTYYFISWAKGHCEKGQKLEVVVADGKRPAPPVAPPTPSPKAPPHPPSPSPPAVHPPAPSPAPSPSPEQHKSAASPLSKAFGSLKVVVCGAFLMVLVMLV